MHNKNSRSLMEPLPSTSTSDNIWVTRAGSETKPNQPKMLLSSVASTSPELSRSNLRKTILNPSYSFFGKPPRRCKISMKCSNSCKFKLPSPSTSTSSITSFNTCDIGSIPNCFNSLASSLASTNPDWSASHFLNASANACFCMLEYSSKKVNSSSSLSVAKFVTLSQQACIHSGLAVGKPATSSTAGKLSLCTSLSSRNFL
mmetsp:Transcript_74519/g.207037  ORF Transcript_74519/g.207037 Transcript_74519/m.207037 type:complete len:202 (-) Transcript_74519:153-758(-)